MLTTMENPARPHARGFTLTELLVTMTLIGVLAAIALPGYGETTRRVLRQDARLALLRIQYRQEQYFSRHLHYATALAGSPDALGLPARSDAGHYLLHIETPAGSGYLAVARADPAGRQARDVRCAQLAVDEAGQRRVGDAHGQWQDEDPDRCWG
ncbi:MAG: type IV pilin protein [Steroidobacteraceae bacterium]